MGLRVLRNADLVLLVPALPLFLVANLPMAGYAVGGGAYVVQRAIRAFLHARANASDEPRTVAGLLVASMLVRGWLVAGSLFAVGVNDSHAGLAAAVLCLALFSVYLTVQLTLRPFEGRKGAP
jgi:hypothetical protein